MIDVHPFAVEEGKYYCIYETTTHHGLLYKKLNYVRVNERIDYAQFKCSIFRRDVRIIDDGVMDHRFYFDNVGTNSSCYELDNDEVLSYLLIDII